MSSLELAQDILLMQQITARAKLNEEILGRINSADMEREFTYSISTPFDSIQNRLAQPTSYHFSEIALIKSRSQFAITLLELCQPIQVQPVEDFFNDKLDYSTHQFADLARLNKAMLPIATKYELLGSNPKVIAVLQKFKENYDNIHIALGKIEQNCHSRQVRLNAVRTQVTALNKRLEELKEDIEKLKTTINNQTY
jgi:hypothetical protein